MNNVDLFSDNIHYVGVVETHELVPSKKSNTPTLILRVRLVGKARTPNDLALADGYDALEPALQVVRTLYFDLDPQGPKLDKVMAELSALGYEFTNVARLHPEHPKHFSFKGKKALLRVWLQDTYDDAGNPIRRDKWFVVTRRKVETFAFSDFSSLIEENADAYAKAAEANETAAVS